MKIELLKILRCPRTGQPLRAVSVDGVTLDADHTEIRSGWLISSDDQQRYPVRGGIPRFVPETNYADNFGMQWNEFSKTQLDSHSGHPISARRFWSATGWKPASLAGHWVLDAGCGAGRFAEVALDAGATVVALDFSSAVDACDANLRSHPNLHVVQGDIYSLPFHNESFSFVYSLGVLQHTPDVAKAFFSLPPLIRSGGSLCVDFYRRSWKSALLPKYWLRPLTKRLPKNLLFAALKRLVPILLPVSVLLGRTPAIGHHLRRVVPVANYVGSLPLSEAQQLEWSLLDTFDWLSPAYDNPQTPKTVLSWFERAGMARIEVLHAGHLVGRGEKP
jgi:2-polyprenyl-3-methyl-5-hydroxy-6-metoxy-1,4-benzoquinol methylase